MANHALHLMLSSVLKKIKWDWRDLTCVAALTIAVVIFHWRGLVAGQAFLPVDLANRVIPTLLEVDTAPLQNWLISDPLYQFYAFLDFQIRALQKGDSIYWSPFIYLGHPAFADPLFQTFYPVYRWLGQGWGAARGLTLGIVVHVLLACYGCFALVRSLGWSRWSAVFAALVYALSGYMVTWFEFVFWISTLAWLPVLLFFYRKALILSRFVYIGLAGAVLGVAILAGQLQFVLIYVLGLGAVTLFYIYQNRTYKTIIHACVTCFGVCLIGVLIGGLQLLPFAEYLALSRRQIGDIAPVFMPLDQLFVLLVPHYYGNPSQSLGEYYWGWANFNEGAIYAGVVTVYLALISLFKSKISAKRTLPIGLAISLLILIYFVVGGEGSRQFLQLPIVRYLSAHRSVFVMPLLLGLMASCAVHTATYSKRVITGVYVGLMAVLIIFVLLDWGTLPLQPVSRQSLVLSLVWLSAAFIIMMLRSNYYNDRASFQPWRQRMAKFVPSLSLVALCFADLYHFGSAYNPAGAIQKLLEPSPAVEFLQSATSPTDRVTVLQADNRVLLPPNLLMPYFIAEPGGYSSLMTPQLHQLVSRDDPQIEWQWHDRGHNMLPFSHPSERLLDLLNVRFIIKPQGAKIVENAGDREKIVYRDAVVRIEKRMSALPKSYVVYAAQTTGDDPTTIQRLLSPDFDPRLAAITDAQLDLPLRAPFGGTPAQINTYQHDHVVLRATAVSKGLLVFSDSFYPGWRATVNGVNVPIVRTNLVMRGVALPAGDNVVEFVFAPNSLRWGWVSFGAGLLLVFALVIVDVCNSFRLETSLQSDIRF